MNSDIKHQGIVDEIAENCVKVRIVQTSACASCNISSHCSASESKEKVVDVYTTDTGSLQKGDTVTVVAAGRTGLIAVALSAVIPLMIIIVVLAAVLAATADEAAAALCGIASLIPYYIILYALRDKISRRVSFRIDHGE